MSATVWPKPRAVLTDEQVRIRDQWMKIWLEEHQSTGGVFTLLERFNHHYPLRTAHPGARTLELGAGVGAHAGYEELGNQEYHANELRPELADRIRARFPSVRTVTSDCQTGLDFPDQHFDRVLAIHVLEHLPNLPGALDEVHRLLKPSGAFSIVIPAEGGFAYSLARRVSSKRAFEKRFNQSYDWLIASEHVNDAREVMRELEQRFVVGHREYFPLRVPSIETNLFIGLTARRR